MQPVPDDINAYLRLYAAELEGRVLSQFPPIHRPEDGDWASLTQLRRKPYPAQALAIMAIAKRWDLARSAAVVAECGTGKTLVSLGAVHAHARGRRYTAVAMVPPMLTNKWCREILITLPGVRVFLIDGLRNEVSSNGHTGVNEVRLRNGQIVREGLHTTLSDLRLRKHAGSARARWDDLCRASSIFVVSRERAKLGYFWRHSFLTPRSGPYLGCVVNPDTGRPILTDTDQLRRSDFRKAKLSEVILPDEGALNARRPLFSPLWQADGSKVRRYAPVDFLSRYLSDGFFDYAIADEVHELKGGETAQGNALGALARCAEHIAILTGTLLGGYADELFHILFRLDAKKMVADGFEHGEAGLRRFSETYGVLEKVTVIEPQDNACSEARISKRIRRRPGASPLLFGRYLMEMSAFLSLEDISSALPSYTEEVLGVDMDPILRSGYDALERDIKQALQDHRGNQSVISSGLNALLLYPDRPFGLGDLVGYELDESTGRREPFLISSPADLAEDVVYAKEQRLLEEIRSELATGRKVQVYAVYTRTRDVTRRLQRLLTAEGIRAEVLTAEVPPEQREAWYDRHLKAGMQVCICHPKLVQTGLDLLDFPTLIFAQTGYSIYVLRQASRRSWRIGQRRPVKVKYLHYANSMQESCLRLMGKKLLVSLAMEGKFASHGLQSLEDDDDMLTAMARELVTQKGVGERADAVWKTLQAERGSAAMTTAVNDTTPAPLIATPQEIPTFAAPCAPTAHTIVRAEQLSLEF
jgi:hypothetical protein